MYQTLRHLLVPKWHLVLKAAQTWGSFQMQSSLSCHGCGGVLCRYSGTWCMIHPAGARRVTANTHRAKTDCCRKIAKEQESSFLKVCFLEHRKKVNQNNLLCYVVHIFHPIKKVEHLLSLHSVESFYMFFLPRSINVSLSTLGFLISDAICKKPSDCPRGQISRYSSINAGLVCCSFIIAFFFRGQILKLTYVHRINKTCSLLCWPWRNVRFDSSGYLHRSVALKIQTFEEINNW